ncbi:hypothetical protein AB0C59_03195 [Streptomyces sp. NPDC048664]|uniref:Rv1733c family protein n=1 Tax=Streptomyces sp. NPDC048664 TaxID=3154505 RepID=UPI00342A7162
MRAITGLWRWRRNPLRRGTDLAEAWVALVALVLIAVAAPLAGAVVGMTAQHSLRGAAREQRGARHPVTATVVARFDGDTTRPHPDPRTGRTGIRVIAAWTAPDGTVRRGPVLARLREPHPGDRFTLWTDDQGRTAARPLDSSTITTHAVLAAAGVALLTAALLESGHRLAVQRMLRRRYAAWDQAWEKAGPDWGRTGTGS